MALRIISQGRSQLHALQHFKLRHAAFSTSRHPLFNPLNKESKKQGYLKQIGLRSASEEDAPTEPEVEATPNAALADNPFLNLGVDDRLMVSFQANISFQSNRYRTVWDVFVAKMPILALIS